jgi:hypothetical protein
MRIDLVTVSASQDRAVRSGTRHAFPSETHACTKHGLLILRPLADCHDAPHACHVGPHHHEHNPCQIRALPARRSSLRDLRAHIMPCSRVSAGAARAGAPGRTTHPSGRRRLRLASLPARGQRARGVPGCLSMVYHEGLCLGEHASSRNAVVSIVSRSLHALVFFVPAFSWIDSSFSPLIRLLRNSGSDPRALDSALQLPL